MPTDPTLAAYQAEQRGLMGKRRALVDAGATQEQLQAWRQQKAARFADLRQKAQTLAASSALQPRPVLAAGRVAAPANASPTLAAFLTDRAALVRARAQVHNQLLQSMSATATVDDVAKMQAQGQALFQRQYGDLLKLQTERTRQLAQESAQQTMSVPPPLRVPTGASPQLAAYLVARDALMREHIQMQNQYAAADETTRQAALQNWRQQNAGRLSELQQLAQTLARGN